MTLIELCVVMPLLGLLLVLALPSWQQQVRRARRADAFAALAQIELAQSRWRSRHAEHAGSLGADGLALPTRSPAGHYALALDAGIDDPASAFRATASALGDQAGDTDCRWLAIEYAAGALRPRSGPDARLDNDAARNRDCWRP